jgi:hypothetical protein
VDFALDPKSLSYWDTGTHDWVRRAQEVFGLRMSARSNFTGSSSCS